MFIVQLIELLILLRYSESSEFAAKDVLGLTLRLGRERGKTLGTATRFFSFLKIIKNLI